MGLEDLRKKIKKELIGPDGKVNWEYLKKLKGKTEGYGNALFMLKDRKIISSEPRGNYFVYDPATGIHLEPRLSPLRYLWYFPEEEHAKEFAKALCPAGLVAKVLG